MDGTAYIESKTSGKLGLMQTHQQRDTLPGSVVIPTSSPTCVVVKSFKTAVDKPRGTIKLRTQMDNAFPLFLRGKCTEEEFKHTIDGINWFANVLLEAEIEFYAETYANSVAWKDVRADLVIRDMRERILQEWSQNNKIAFVPGRERMVAEPQMKEYLQRVIAALHDFIDDENKRVYLHNGVQWNYPEKNHWRWLEIHVLPDGAEKVPVTEPLLSPPAEPVFGDSLKFEVLETVTIDDHSEYVVHITTNLKTWHPITDTLCLRRFNEFKEFYNTLNEYMDKKSIEVGMPRVGDGSYIGRNSRSTLLKRKTMFQDLLDSITTSPELMVAPPVLDFFGITPDPEDWKFRPYLNRQLSKQ